MFTYRHLNPELTLRETGRIGCLGVQQPVTNRALGRLSESARRDARGEGRATFSAHSCSSAGDFRSGSRATQHAGAGKGYEESEALGVRENRVSTHLYSKGGAAESAHPSP
jgi:hypothetical protein